MKHIIMTAAIVLAALSACNFSATGSNGSTSTSGTGGTRTENLAPFDALTVNIPVDITYETGDPGIVIVASDKYMDHIIVQQDGESVTVKSDDKKIRSFKDVKIYVTSDRLSELTVNGAVDMECKRGVKAVRDLAITLNGASDVEINGVEAENVTVKCNGAADIELEGLAVRTIDVTINGAGDVKLAGAADKAVLTINGAGDIDARRLAAAIIRPSVRGVGSIRTE